jgi:uroporphyrinogen-III decarboxylase
MLLEPELMGEVMDAITDVRIALLQKTYEATKFEAIFFHDDWGSKHSLFFRPETWRELIKPREKRIVDAIKSMDKNILYIHHSDTFLEPLIPEMIEIGIDVWQGCIPQNDIVKLQKNFKGQIGFMGGIDIAKIDRKSFDEEEIRQEVRRAIDTYAPYGGFVPGIPSAAALYDGVQKIYLDEVTKYAAEYSAKHFRAPARV